MKSISKILLCTVCFTIIIFDSCKKSDPCESVFCFNGGICYDGKCHCPIGYEGEFCEIVIVKRYDCVNGSCISNGSLGQYSSLAECQTSCGQSSSGYNCVNGNCIFTSSNAQFATLLLCQNNCSQSGICSFAKTAPSESSIRNSLVSFYYDKSKSTNLTEAASMLRHLCQDVSIHYISNNAIACGKFSNGYHVAIAPNTYNKPNVYGLRYGYDDSHSFIGSNLTYFEIDKGSGGGGTNNSTITFTNTSYTDVTISFNGFTKIASPSGSAVFEGTPGKYVSGTATTSGKTKSGNQVGLLLTWNLNYSFPSIGNQSIELSVQSNLFFLQIRNNGTTNLSPLYVNYGLQSEIKDNIIIPNDRQLYSLGYYKAFSNSNVRLYRENNQQQYVYWDNLNISGTKNILVSLTNSK